ncbi:MAG: thioredoxin family protein [Conexivisphaerales archaeon]
MQQLISDEDAEEIKTILEERLREAKDPPLIITITPSSQTPENCPYCEEIEYLANKLAELSGNKVKSLNLHEDAKEIQERFKVKRLPVTIVTNEKMDYALKFYGLPAGYEFAALLDDITDASYGNPSGLSQTTIQKLKTIDKPVHIQVFVTPSCPYCPRAVRTAHQMSIANPKMIDSEMIESMEFPELAEKYYVMAVPKVVINDSVEFEGALPENVFLYKVQEAVAG